MSAASNPPPPYQAHDPLPSIVPSAQRVQSTFYHVYRSQFGNYRVLLDDKIPSFYINSRRLRVPDLIVHRGNGDYDREVANCIFPEFTDHYELNLFREANKKSPIVRNKMTSNGRFTATVPVPDTRGGTSSAQRPFIWKHTSSLMLNDEETGQTAAVMHGMVFGLKKCFVLETQVPYSSTFEVLVVTTAVAMYENTRRGQSGPSAKHHGPRTAARAGAASYAGVMWGGAMDGGAIGGAAMGGAGS